MPRPLRIITNLKTLEKKALELKKANEIAKLPLPPPPWAVPEKPSRKPRVYKTKNTEKEKKLQGYTAYIVAYDVVVHWD